MYNEICTLVAFCDPFNANVLAVNDFPRVFAAETAGPFLTFP
jgi:hypothetical protein